jgi:SpoVK/Ycf46/Vps4 family AAA+-type ATPase
VGERHAIVAQLLSLMDGFEKDQENKVTVIAATNLPQVLDQGIYRRFRMSIEMTPPDDEGLFKLIMLYGGKHRYEPVMMLQKLSHVLFQQVSKGLCLEDLAQTDRQSYLAINELVALTRGATPALIKSTFETAAIKAAFDRKDVIEHGFLLETFKIDMKRYQREEKLRKARILFAFGKDVDDENLSYFI